MISRLAHYGRRDQGNLVGTTNPVDPGRRDYATHGYISAKDSYLKRLKLLRVSREGCSEWLKKKGAALTSLPKYRR